MTKAVGYIRVATQGQVRGGYSLSFQRDEIMRYCTDNDIELLHIHEDKGISGAKVDEDGLTVEREGLQSMLADLATVEVECVCRPEHLAIMAERYGKGSDTTRTQTPSRRRSRHSTASVQHIQR